MDHVSQLPLFILLFPLLGFLINGVALPCVYRGVESVPVFLSGCFATSMMIISFCLALAATGMIRPELALSSHVFEWLTVGEFSFGVDLVLDELSAVMVLIITGIGGLIHMYSIAYMAHEKGGSRFFTYLNLFCFFMLLLVLSDNLLFLFFGWEGVGLCSYLLISYWYEETANCEAGKKAFLVNRIGDVAFTLGLFVLLWQFKSLSVSAIKLSLGETAPPMIGFATLMLFLGATGKSAQFPLYIWLPDAMAGPTPVSALIHAATMVTAGVYAIARLYFLFDLAPGTLLLIVHIGALTALIGSFIALQQYDIKKVLAYSTVSQLGFMFMAVGVGAYKTAIFHLMSHAFFKALLFLGSGSVIHACNGEQDMRKLGGLAKPLKISHFTMLIGSAALMGLPIFSGFFSKDAVLFAVQTLPGGGLHLWLAGAVAAFLTAVYTVRMLWMTFYGATRYTGHPHESPLLMTVPLMVLAVLATVGGFLGFPHEFSETIGIHLPNVLESWLGTILPGTEYSTENGQSEIASAFVATLIALMGMGLGFMLFSKKFDLPFGKDTLLGKFYVDEFYGKFLVTPFLKCAGLGSIIIENTVQRLTYSIVVVTQRIGFFLKDTQTGDLQHSVVTLVLAVMTFAIALVFA